ncbi:MucR family transcriptional regulator [Paramagnetospirillum marisnigri]|uniref:MucR family transcriptional regulator n=1 Tax=Paramagnetospirillum marisnigri TaxID=1285242 RepID=UPI0009EE3EB6|nr:MucR family transcriptional regulator [Paramagnetospirillum marisnigri]
MTDAIALTARIVAAFLRGNEVPVANLPGIIEATHAALVRATSQEPVLSVSQHQPAVPVKKSVTPSAINCLECGKGLAILKNHLRVAHGLSVADYRVKWSLPTNYPLVAQEYAQRRSEMAKAIGLGHSRNKVQPTPDEVLPQHRYPASRWAKSSV